MAGAGLVALAAVVTIGLTGCSHASGGAGRLTVEGKSQVTPVNGSAHPAHSGDVIHAGDRVQVVSGQALVRLVPNGLITMRKGTQLVVDKTLRLNGGDILIQPIDGPLVVVAQEATLSVPSGVAQLAVNTDSSTLGAKVYQATSTLEIAGNPPAPITAPRQIILTPTTRLPVVAAPLQYNDSDAWDHTYLDAAAAISTQLGAAATGLNAQVPATQGKDPGYYLRLLPTLADNPDFADAFAAVQRLQPIGTAPAARPGDYLVASVIALRGTNGTFQSRLNDELVFYAQGAPWGFVAYDQGVTDLGGVLNDVLAAIGRAGLPSSGAPPSQFAIGPPPTTPGSPTTRPNRTGTTTPTTTPANPRPAHPTTPTTPTTLAPIHLPVPLLPGPLGSLLNPLLDPLIQALNNILGGKG